ncbi:MAG TPA: ABC transporter permease [Desulfatiglandales bacterium]|nr:ABC transporter permease [Desulfatiglandales bacterium]
MKPIELTKPNNDVLFIAPSRGWRPINFKELWRYRELLYFLTWRDVKIKYKQTLLGVAWAVLQPFFTMIVFTIFFGRLAKIPSEGVPYPIFSYAGLLLWTYFTGAVSRASNSLVGGTNLITKIYFPRILMPVASTLAGIIDYFIALSILILMMVFYHVTPGVSMLLLPILLLCSLMAATGVGFWLSALNVKYRDIKYVVPFLIQLWLFATPVIYPASMLPEKYQWILSLNPMAGVIEAHRACILGNKPVDWNSLIISVGMILLIFISGAFYFKKMERSFADVI